MSSKDEMISFLHDHGWLARDVESPWRYYDPHYPAAHYRLEDAFELVKSQKENK